jgi:hypothetical protein
VRCDYELFSVTIRFTIQYYGYASNNNEEFYMARTQIGEALEYKTVNSFHKIIQKNADIIGNPTMDILSTVEGDRAVSRNIELYSFTQLFQILRFSKQPKANLFMDWAALILKELIMGSAELTFANPKREKRASYNNCIFYEEQNHITAKKSH